MSIEGPLLSNDLLQTFRVCTSRSKAAFSGSWIFPHSRHFSGTMCEPTHSRRWRMRGTCLTLTRLNSSVVTHTPTKIRNLAFRMMLISLFVFDGKQVRPQPVKPDQRISHRGSDTVCLPICLLLAAETPFGNGTLHRTGVWVTRKTRSVFLASTANSASGDSFAVSQDCGPLGIFGYRSMDSIVASC